MIITCSAQQHGAQIIGYTIVKPWATSTIGGAKPKFWPLFLKPSESNQKFRSLKIYKTWQLGQRKYNTHLDKVGVWESKVVI